jgi:hypothetical protein
MVSIFLKGCKMHTTRTITTPKNKRKKKRNKKLDRDPCVFQSIKDFLGWAPMAHAYKPSYSGGRDQEDHSLKPASGSLRDTITKKKKKKKNHKKRLIEWLKV